MRMALPLVQRLLPLLDGNIGSAVSNLLNPHPQAPLPLSPVHLAPIEDGLAELQAEHRDLRGQVLEQNASLNRVADQLERVSETIDHITLAQQEQNVFLKRVEEQIEMASKAADCSALAQQKLMGELKAVGRKINVFALAALGLLAVSIALNVILLLYFRHVLP
jgi:methyl-accepting chemotaxis protein